MVSLYGAGERTGVMNVEGKLAKVLEKDSGRLVIKASERDSILDQISARAARYKDVDADLYDELMQLRKDVKDVFNKGLAPGDDIMEQLYFLDPKTRDFVEKLSRQYTSVVTPDDFKQIASIMSEYMGEEVPILKDFTRFFGRLAQDFVIHAKPSDSTFDWKTIAGETIRGSRYMGKKLPRPLALALGLNPDKPFKEEVLKRFDWYNPNSTWSDLLFGMRKADFRKTGVKKSYLEFEYPTLKFNKLGVTTGGESVKVFDWSFGTTGNLPKDWTQIPWVNFDGKVLEQKFTQSFEERLRYKAADGSWVTNIVQVSQKTDPSWWEEVLDKSGKINEIVDATKARTSYPVNANHSNDATLVKNFHLWGSKSKVTTATIHDAFFTNAADMLKAKSALRQLYAEAMERNVVLETLDEMRKRGLPQDLYDQYLNEAIDKGIIPVPGRSVVGGRVLTIEDILTKEDILQILPKDFTSNRSFYGVGG